MVIINKDFFLLWSGQLVSQIGDKFYSIALAWWILEKTNSPVAMGLFLVASVLPGLIIGPFAGTLIDHWNRKTVIIVSDIVRGLVVLSVTILSLYGLLTVSHVYLSAIMISLASAFFNPTIIALIPQIVAEQQLPRANALSELIGATSMIFGPLLGAAFVAFLGFSLVFLLNGMSYILSAFFESFIRTNGVAAVNTAQERYQFVSEFKKGLRYLSDKRELLIIIAVIGIAHLFVGTLMVALPFLAKSLQGNSVRNLGNLEMMMGIGMFSAAFLQAKVKEKLQDTHLFLFMMMMGCCYFLIGISNALGILDVAPYMILVLVVGAMIASASIYWRSLLQMNTATEFSGRVFSISNIVGNSSLPVSYGITGVLLSYFSLNTVMILAGLGLIILCGFLMLFYKQLGSLHDLY